MKTLKIVMFLFLSISFVGCEEIQNEIDDEIVCGVKDPINNLTWLNSKFKSLIGGPEINGIVLYKFNNDLIIEIQSSVYNSTNQHQYYCSGEKIDFNKITDFNNYKQNRIELKMLYGTKIWN